MPGRNKFRCIDGGRRWKKSDVYQRRGRSWWRYVPLWLGAVAIGIGGGAMLAERPNSTSEAVTVEDYAERIEPPAPAPGLRTHFGSCHTGGGHNCVVDGDTLYVEGVKIRVADVDAPETHEPKCPGEKALGDRATIRLRQLVNSGPVTLSSIDRDEDAYGRKLRIVKVDGVSVGVTLVGEGLARWYAGGRRPWC